MKDGLNGELQFGMSRLRNRASVPLKEDMNLEQLEHCSARVLIQLRVQQNTHEENMLLEHESQVHTTSVRINSRGQ